MSTRRGLKWRVAVMISLLFAVALATLILAHAPVYHSVCRLRIEPWEEQLLDETFFARTLGGTPGVRWKRYQGSSILEVYAEGATPAEAQASTSAMVARLQAAVRSSPTIKVETVDPPSLPIRGSSFLHGLLGSR